MDKLNAMATFVEIVDRGSLTAAAQGLGKSLPTVVRTLGTLEEALGVRLLRRTTRRMSLTEEGRAYLGRCRQILADVTEAEESLTHEAAELRGRLRITAPVRFGQMHVVPVVAGFLARHPKVSVDLVLLDRVVNLVEEGIDLGVRIARLPDASMIAIPVAEQRPVVCGSPGLLRRLGTPRHPRALSDAPCIHVRGLAPSATWNFSDRGKPLAVSVRGPLSCNQVGAALDACARGLGFGQFLSYQVAPLAKAKQLRVVLSRFEPPPIPVSIVVPHGKLVSVRVRAFIDALKRDLGTR